MSMRFGNSSEGRGFPRNLSEDGVSANLRKLNNSRARAGIFDGRYKRARHLRERNQPEALRAFAGRGNALANPVHR